MHYAGHARRDVCKSFKYSVRYAGHARRDVRKSLKSVSVIAATF